MAGSILQQLDGQLDALFAGWNLYTTLLCLVLGAYLIYPLFFYTEPDTHPMLLVRQASNSYVRQPGESAVYRSLEVPQGYPLRSGLAVKDPGAPRWTAGRNGDLRDIWAQAVRGPLDSEGKSSGHPGKIISLLGKEEVSNHDLSEITRDINSLGQYFTSHDAHHVAIYVPNSAELIVSFFASTLYGITPILVPFSKPAEQIAEILKKTKGDFLVAAAGSLPLEGILQGHPGLKHVIWVAERSSRHMEWNEIPEGVGGNAEVAVWHEVVEEKRSSASAEVPSSPTNGSLPNVVTVSFGPEQKEIVEFTQANLVSGVAAQLSALPRSQSLGPSDILLPLAPLTDQYPLVLTLAALFSNSSVALTPASGPAVDYVAAFRAIHPTILVASPKTLAKHHEDRSRDPAGLLQKITRWRQARSLAAGIMPVATGIAPKPRLIYTFERSDSGTTPLTATQISDLRVLTGAYIVNAFTATKVAGAISQTNMFDYGIPADLNPDSPSHYGPPLSSVEIKLVDFPGRKDTDENFTEGKLIINGPAVIDGSTDLESIMKITDNNTLRYAR